MKEYRGYKLTHETDIVANHQPALIWAIENSIGNVLELGTGNSSTDFLHIALSGTGRKLVSVEDDLSWIKTFRHLESTEHEFMLINRSVDDWNNTIDHLSTHRWGVVFVDQGYGEEIWRPTRNYAVSKLVRSADYIIVHDADLFPEMKSDDYFCMEFTPKIQPSNERRVSTYVISANHDVSHIIINE
jgi:hypothetical protein